jgi:hypothetical protein
MDVCMKEALGCRDGLQLAVKHGERRVVLETDCLELINLWQKKGMSNDLLLDRSWRRSMLLVLPFIVFLFLMSIDLVIR